MPLYREIQQVNSGQNGLLSATEATWLDEAGLNLKPCSLMGFTAQLNININIIFKFELKTASVNPKSQEPKNDFCCTRHNFVV